LFVELSFLLLLLILFILETYQLLLYVFSNIVYAILCFAAIFSLPILSTGYVQNKTSAPASVKTRIMVTTLIHFNVLSLELNY